MTRGSSFHEDIPRCPRCALGPAYCICEGLVPIQTRTRIVIVRHVRELFRPSGTARIAALALPRAEVVDYRDERGEAQPDWLSGDPRTRHFSPRPPDAVGAHLSGLSGAHLLFPTGRAPEDLPAPPTTLIVLDGTWRQARAMYQRIPGAAALPAVRLSASAQPVARLRVSRREGDRSTLEAIADALAVLEGPEVGAALHALHARFVEHSLRARGKLDHRC